MQVNLFPFALGWALLALMVIALIIYRKIVSSREDDILHVMQGETATGQAMVAQKLDQIDRWGKILTILAIVYGLVVAGAYVYQNWVQASNYLGN